MIAGKFRPAAHTSRPAGLSAESFTRFFRRVYILHSAPCANNERTVKSPLAPRRRTASAAAPSAFARPAQTMSEPSSPSHVAQANRFCRRAQRILTPSANHEQTVKPLSCRAGELFCRRAQRIRAPCANHERTVKPLTRRAGELLCRRAQRIRAPSAPGISCANHERIVKPLTRRAGESLCRRAQRIIPPRRPTAPCARRCASPWRGRARDARPAGGGSPRPA